MGCLFCLSYNRIHPKSPVSPHQLALALLGQSRCVTRHFPERVSSCWSKHQDERWVTVAEQTLGDYPAPPGRAAGMALAVQ